LPRDGEGSKRSNKWPSSFQINLARAREPPPFQSLNSCWTVPSMSSVRRCRIVRGRPQLLPTARPALPKHSLVDIELVVSNSGQKAPPFPCIKAQIWPHRVPGTSYIYLFDRYCHLNTRFISTIRALAPIKLRAYGGTVVLKIHNPFSPDNLEINSNDCSELMAASSRRMKISEYRLTSLSFSR
jgi:hypothetical protein